MTGQDVSQAGFGPGFGFDFSTAGGFPAMGFAGGDMNQMQQMQMMMAMQNGMAPTAFNSFPMMGMSILLLSRTQLTSNQECRV